MMGIPRRAQMLTAAVIISNVLGNLLLSAGMKAQVLTANAKVIQYAKVLLSPLVILGVGLLIFWLLARMALMSWADLSYILPVTSIGYVLSAVAGHVFLAEQISWSRWAGTLFIVAGILLVSTTHHRTTARKRQAAQEPVR